MQHDLSDKRVMGPNVRSFDLKWTVIDSCWSFVADHKVFNFRIDQNFPKHLNYTHFELSICGNLPNLAEHNLIVNRGRKRIIFWEIIVMYVIGSNKSCQNGYIHVYSKWHDEPSPRPYAKLNFIKVMSHNN